MTQIKLKTSKVKFIEETHQYFLGKKELKGITGTLINKAFPNTYKGIPENVLMKAAERGGMIHQAFELFCTVCDADIKSYPSPIPEVCDFSDMLQAYDLHHVASEYIVSDNENFASAIDGVFVDGSGTSTLWTTRQQQRCTTTTYRCSCLSMPSGLSR